MANCTEESMSFTLYPFTNAIKGYTEKISLAANKRIYDLIYGMPWCYAH